jgi:hypothetical protein
MVLGTDVGRGEAPCAGVLRALWGQGKRGEVET